MILNTEQLRQKAHELALTHEPYITRWPLQHIWRDFEDKVKDLKSYIRSLQDPSAHCSQPAEEWLLDNAEFIQEQVVVVRQQLAGLSTRKLSNVRRTKDNRVLSICADYLQHVDGNLEEDSLISYLNSYQQVSVLSIAENWAIPSIMRVALINHLCRVMEYVQQQREACELAEKIISSLDMTKLDAETLKAALDEAGQEIPLSGSFIVHLTRQLREWADDSLTVREWLMCKLDNGAESFDGIVSYEYQLQATYQVTTGNIITSLRNISRWDWQNRFEQICMVEQALREESTGIYSLLDFPSRDQLRQKVEKLAYRFNVPETLVAKQAVMLAERKGDQTLHVREQPDKSNPSFTEELPRQAFVAYYLLESKGIKELRNALKICGTPRQLPKMAMHANATGSYFFVLTLFLLAVIKLFTEWIGPAGNLTFSQWVLAILALLLPASEWAIIVTHWLIEILKRPQPILKYDFSRGIPPEATTMVVIPVIWSTIKEVQTLVSRLELHYLANRNENIFFGLLVDLTDSNEEKPENDALLIDAARKSIEELNSMYSRAGGDIFYLFQRHRSWNKLEGIWMGWERKRGALVEFVELLKGKSDNTCQFIVGENDILPKIRYVITLDADTQLPMETALRMIGAIHLPYNRPRLNKSRTRVVEGYGVLQPSISISHNSAIRSRFASLYSAEPGIDPYTFAVSDPYQDAFSQGIFAGKGIFDVDSFAEVLCERIPDNRVLSHDLLEGGFLRAGFLSDIELIDEYPSTFASYQKRMHRWVRGDWQLLPWIFKMVPDRRNNLLPVDLSPLTRWQMIDNLRHSLLLPVLFAILLLGITVLPGSPERWVAIVLATLSLPLIRQLIMVRSVLLRPKGLLAVGGQLMVTIVTWPFQVILLLDAISRTLYRLFISKCHLLEWVSAAEVERRNRKGSYPIIMHMYGGYALIFVFALLVTAGNEVVIQRIGLSLALIWATAPLIINWLNRPVQIREKLVSEEENEELLCLARDIWAFFEDYVTEEENWLPPDNVQIEPPKGIAHRTSPTNIGLYLVCVLAARDFGFIDTRCLIESLERTLGTVESLEKWEGHLYNWYDTRSLEPLPMPYVSTVDSGNFVASLVAVREGLLEWINSELKNSGSSTKHIDIAMGESSFAFSHELSVAKNPGFGLSVFPHPEENETESNRIDWEVSGHKLIERLDRLIDAADFDPLYDRRTKLFHLGYRVTLREMDKVLYDLLASEARLASFLAVALGQVPVSHWYALGRTMTRVGRRITLLSWSGTMFEYLMPSLFMKTYFDTVWDSTYQAAVKRQIEYAHQRGVPFGISESGYYAFDYRMNYQYRAFGVPGLGFKRGLEQDLVVAPYATILALPFAKQQGINDLKKIKKFDAYGKYGYYEALDFTPERLPKNKSSAVIRSYMAHHQGMSLIALSNLLLPQKIYERFHRDKRVQAAELLLQEKIPSQPKIIRHPAMAHTRRHIAKTENAHGQREFRGAETLVPEVCLLSNGAFTTMVTNSGSGFMRYKGMALSRWREDPILDGWGNYLYIRDVTRNIVWSPAYHPCRVVPDEQRVQFSPDRATFMRVDQEIQTSLEICVSSEWNADVRRLTLTNTGNEDRIIEVTTFSELAMAFPMADDAHPSFNKLFVKTEYSPDIQCLLASRRSRHEHEKTLWMAHSLMFTGRTLGPMEYETDRASFIGRGHSIAEPLGINSHLRGSVGSVTDPAFIMRQRISIAAGEQIQLYAITTVADSKEEVMEIISRFSGELVVERAFQLAWNRSQIELRHLNMTTQEAMVIHALAGRVWYTSPLNKIRKQNIAANTKGQSGLWCYGISGDLPIILVRIENRANMQFVVRLLTGHVYLRRMGCHFDLVILNESVNSYQEDLAEAIRRAVENSFEPHSTGLGDVFIIHASHLPEVDRILLLSVAQMIFQADGPSLRAQSKPPRMEAVLPSLLAPVALPNRFPVSGKMLPHLLFYNGWGGFSREGHEYIIIKSENHLPAPWVNVLANPEFGCLISELGTGYTWWQNSRELKLTPWSNDPVLDQPGEMCYLRDEDSGEIWSTAPFFSDIDNPYYVTHGWGYTHFSHERHGISHKTTVIVPSEEPIKILKVRLHNKTAEHRTISVTYYAEWVLGVQRSKNAPYIITEWDESSQTMLANNTYQEIFRNATGFLGIYPQTGKAPDPLIAKEAGISRPDTELSWTADRLEFLGRNGTWEYPAALARERLSGRTGILYNTCGAVQAKIHLEPGTEQTVIIVLGCEDSSEAAINLAQKYSRVEACDEAFEIVRESWTQTLGQITVSTPSPQMNILLNGWLLYQTIACRIWARSGFYQAGGAFGFRDQLQDSMALLHSRPDLTRKQILFHAQHQYEEGDVQHWWHEETECGIRTLFTDDYLWLPYAVGRYVISTGDYSLLEEVVPYLSSEPLREGEHERYEPTCISTCSGSILEHCFRAIDKALDRLGEHGLPLIGIGDWNDGMSRVGAQGRGESVWLGWFLYEVLNLFIGICDRQNDTVRVEKFQDVQEKMASALNESGWDGQWYRRAFTDSGEWLGSIFNEECRIDAIAQAWAVISGAAPLDKAQQAMQSFDRELVDYELSLVHLLTPPFENTKPSPGYIQGYPPGIRENGAQYTHGAIWGIIAWCQLGNGVKAFELFDLLNPINHTRTASEVRQYTGEPYVMAADVYTADPHKGCAGWTWYTGAAGWMYQAGIDWILGLRRQGKRLYISPCIPNQWPEYSVTYRYGTTRYQILISNPSRKSTGFTEMNLDGQKVLSAELDTKEPFIELIDDGEVHNVEVIM